MSTVGTKWKRGSRVADPCCRSTASSGFVRFWGAQGGEY